MKRVQQFKSKVLISILEIVIVFVYGVKIFSSRRKEEESQKLVLSKYAYSLHEIMKKKTQTAKAGVFF